MPGSGQCGAGGGHHDQGCPGDRARRPADRPAGSAATSARSGRKGGAGETRHDAPARPARRLLRRRHPDHHRPGRHHLLQRPRRRGARPGRALPAHHDGAVRAAGAGGRPAARPVPARPALRAGGHHARPGVPGLADLRLPPRLRALPGRVRRARAVPGVRRGPQRRRAPAAAARPRPVRGRRPGLHLRHRGRRGRGADRRCWRSGSARSGRCGWRRSSSSSARWWRCGCRPGPTRIRPRCCRGSSRCPAAGPSRCSPAGWSSRRWSGSAGAARAVRLPDAVPGVRDQVRQPCRPGSSASPCTRRRRWRSRSARWASARSSRPRSAPGCASDGRCGCRRSASSRSRSRRWPRWSSTPSTFVVLLCLVTAIASGLAKLAVDASIQERIPENVRASAFAHSETLLMLAWVVGGAIGLIPFSGRIGIGTLRDRHGGRGRARGAGRDAAAQRTAQRHRVRLDGRESDCARDHRRRQPRPQPVDRGRPSSSRPAAPTTVRVRPFRTLAATAARHRPRETTEGAGPAAWSRRKAAVRPPQERRAAEDQGRTGRATDVLPRGPERPAVLSPLPARPRWTSANEGAGRSPPSRPSDGRGAGRRRRRRGRRPSAWACAMAAATHRVRAGPGRRLRRRWSAPASPAASTAGPRSARP